MKLSIQTKLLLMTSFLVNGTMERPENFFRKIMKRWRLFGQNVRIPG